MKFRIVLLIVLVIAMATLPGGASLAAAKAPVDISGTWNLVFEANGYRAVLSLHPQMDGRLGRERYAGTANFPGWGNFRVLSGPRDMYYIGMSPNQISLNETHEGWLMVQVVSPGTMTGILTVSTRSAMYGKWKSGQKFTATR